MYGEIRIEVYTGDQKLPNIYFLKASIVEAVIVELKDKPDYTFDGYIYGKIAVKIEHFGWIKFQICTKNRSACIDIIGWITDPIKREQYLDVVRNMKSEPGGD